MGQSFELQAASEKNPDKNSELVHRVKSSRKNSRVTRSQINDFHAHTNTNEKEKEEEEEEEEEEVGEKELNLKNISRTREKKSNRYHVCKHCKRAFSSGRALGGHIRIHRASFTGGGGGGHVDFSYNSSTNSLLKPPEVDGSEDSDSDSSASSHGFSNGCSPKMVSLYTLRNNPKRSSILMDPEFALDLIGASGSVSASASASTAKRSRNSYWAESNSGIVGPCSGSEIRRVLFPNWSVTKSRSSRGGGGGGEVKRDRFLFPKEDAVADDRDTAQLLVMLAGRTRRNNNVDNNEGRESTEESVFDSKPLMISNLESQGSIEDLGGSEESRIVEKKRKRRKKNTHKNERADEAGNSSVKVLESDMDMDVDVDVGGTAILIEEQHQCNTCKKVFNSHQALGGHRASHRKVKGCFAAEGENQEEGGGGEEEEEEEEGEGSLMVEAAVQIEEEGAVAMSHLTQEQESFSHKMGKQPQLQPHRCTICHRVFGSGQALGGHKRCHWIGDRITETTTSAISTEQHQHESGGGGGSVRDMSTREEVLDLNQPPPIDEDYFRGASRFGFDACAESVNQRVKMAGGSFANSTVDSFKAD